MSLFLLGCCGVNRAGEGQEKYGADIYYFQGLEELKNGTEDSEKKALRFFLSGAKKARPVIAQKCTEELTRLYFASGKYNEVIALTAGQDDTAPAELVRLRLTSLLRQNRVEFSGEAAQWFLAAPITPAHSDFLANAALPAGLSPEEAALIQARLAVYNRSYGEACAILEGLCAGQNDAAAWLASLSAPAFSDAGRAFLYGSAEYRRNARLFDQAARAAGASPLGYYALFYAGRFSDRAGESAAAAEYFWKAAEAASDRDQKDDALWYYLTILLKIGTEPVIEELGRGRLELYEKENFADIFDSLALALLQNRDWDGLYAAAGLLPGIADRTAASKYAYLAGRLLEEGYCTPPSGNDPAREAEGFFRAACVPGVAPYYALLAGIKLGLTEAELEQTLFGAVPAAEMAEGPAAYPAPEEIAGNGRLLEGYAEFGFPERIYLEWRNIRAAVTDEDAFRAAEHLQNRDDETLNRQGIFIAASTLNRTSGELAKSRYELAYPRFFGPEIGAACAEFSVPEYVMYSLVRNESLFERTVTSSAGAQGLSQLMDATAADIAQRLKVAEYDLHDAATNVRFGAYYLADLTGRFEGRLIPALCAYNAGASRARSWLRSSNLPPDLFVETVPYQETRNYTRNVLAAAALYGWLYYDRAPADILRELIYI